METAKWGLPALFSWNCIEPTIMLNSDAELTGKLSEAIARLVPRAFGEGAYLESLIPARINRRYSFMFRYWVKKPDQSRHSILVKIPHQDWVKSMAEAIASEQVRQEIKHEFEVMQSIYAVIQNSKHRLLFAINPVGGYILDFNAIVMEEVPLRMLKWYLAWFPILANNQLAWMDFERKLSLAGEWLRLIHDAFQQNRSAKLENLNVRQAFSMEIKTLEKITGDRLDSIHAPFQQLYESIKNVDVPISSLHNDFHLGNIFVTPDGKVGALDPNWKDGGAIYEDLASLLIDPITGKKQVFFQGLAFRRSQRERFERAVLHGYFGKTVPAYSLVHFYCAWTTLEKWRINEERLRSAPRVIRRVGSLFIGVYFRRLVRSYLNLGLMSSSTLNVSEVR